MGEKYKLRLMASVEYEVDSAEYGAGADLDRVLETDLAQAEGIYRMFLNGLFSDRGQVTFGIEQAGEWVVARTRLRNKGEELTEDEMAEIIDYGLQHGEIELYIEGREE